MRKQAMGNRKSRKTTDGKAVYTLITDNVPAAALLERRALEKLGMAPPILEAIEILDYAAMNGVGPEEVVRLAADDEGISMDELAADNTITDADLDVCYRQLGLTSSVGDNDPIDADVSALHARLASLLSKCGDASEEADECSE